MPNDVADPHPACPECGASLHRGRRERVSTNERIKRAMQVLRLSRLSLLAALVIVLDPSQQDFAIHRGRLYESSEKIHELLTIILGDSAGSASLLAWMEPRSVDYVCRKVYNEMDKLKDQLRVKIESITPDFLASWDIRSTIGAAMETHAPVLGKILLSASQTTRACQENIIKDADIACQVIVAQLAKVRSNCSQYFAAPFTLFLWTNGASRQTIEALARCGLCISFTSLTTLLQDLASHCIDRAIQISRRPHALCYDNINISTSIFVEQRPGAPAKVQSGTFPTLYEVKNANPDHFRLSPMLLRARRAPGLVFNVDIRPTFEQTDAFNSQLRVHIIRILFDGNKARYTYPYESDPVLQHKPRRKLPAGIKTAQFPLRTTTIDESSVSGNIAVIEDVYINQLQMSHAELADIAIPSINDQSTNARIRGAKALRMKDINPFTQLQCIQLGFGLFHLCMNLIWALLHIHRGTVGEIGSLSYFFSILDRTRLGCEHPDYHTLLATLMQILRGVILNAWKVECGHDTLLGFLSSDPTPQQLCDIADRILWNHATPSHDTQPTGNPDPENGVPIDHVNRNLQILTRDLLLVLELLQATSDGDFGRIEDILGHLAMVFRGAGSNNYCTEILHFIFNLKHVWTPEFANIMRDQMLINLTGLEGHFMAVDLNIEHLIRFLKRFYAAKGVYASWDRLGDISATVDLLQLVRKQVGRSLGIAYHGITHVTPDLDRSVQKIASKVSELSMHINTPSRQNAIPIKPVVNTLVVGEKKLKSSTLATFNKKIQSQLTGEIGEIDELDEIPPAMFDVSNDPTNDD